MNIDSEIVIYTSIHYSDNELYNNNNTMQHGIVTSKIFFAQVNELILNFCYRKVLLNQSTKLSRDFAV